MFLAKRAKATIEGGPFDWAHAEALAFATLLDSGFPVRLSGQDVRRGTFSHRHCVLYDSSTRERYVPLQNLGASQASFVRITVCCPRLEFWVLTMVII